jgi:hypothetical protein
LRIDRTVSGKLESESLRHVMGGITLQKFSEAFREPLDGPLQTTCSPRLKAFPGRMLQLDIPDEPSIIACFGSKVEPNVNEFFTGVDRVLHGFRGCRALNRHGN